MTIEAINEQLLRAIGVGVALLDLETLELSFRNDTFMEWFGGPEASARLADLFPTLDIEALGAELSDGGKFTAETSFKLKRRRMTVAMDFTRAGNAGERIAVLVCQNITRIKELESMIDSYSMMVERNTHEIKREKEQVEKLLLNMMPRSAYEEYKSFGVVAPRIFESVSVLTLDFENFDRILEANDPAVIVSELNDIYTAFDRIGEQFGCERVRTNGDSYFAVSGVPDPVLDHAESVAKAAVRFLRYLSRRNESHPIRWQARLGLASGPVVGSVVGVQKYIYDVFGPAVERATRTRTRAQGMTVAAHPSIRDLLDSRFTLTPLAPAKAQPEPREDLFLLEESNPATATGPA
ncbi:adenylate/guanylate cyclase domain-containing protein [Tropicimonas sp. IMCC6043]|uniref:adenylate/guanylate cyclase domain-containing protein n=1 Tax=Tropicimonas sp. IMCC6043 TaxID=2510645 RepID=UPI00101D649C|nr:adenylate/guanylate cyclase domain-containing protein [Tropicimonas sp. IMCC6043]RYH11391.1 adenylate/guanylate cyclase domain-containing protein [Tropicimonas sp. IMCC6043]